MIKLFEMNIGNPKIIEVIEHLKYDDFYTQINKYNTFNKIPKSLKLNLGRYDNTKSNFVIGVVFSIFAAFAFFLDNGSLYKIPILFFGGLFSVFFFLLSRDRKRLQFVIELKESEFNVASFQYKWSDIDSIFKICTEREGNLENYGIKLILKDSSEININLALRKPEIGTRDDIFHFIYMFWRRAIKIEM
jgi:hypothetical protein